MTTQLSKVPIGTRVRITTWTTCGTEVRGLLKKNFAGKTGTKTRYGTITFDEAINNLPGEYERAICMNETQEVERLDDPDDNY